MSITTLKKKTNAKYNNSSVGQKQFSINGTTRNQGWVGQTSLSRSFPMTLMNGNIARGHGGHCGTYYQGSNIVSGINCLNDNTIIKPSVLHTKHHWIKNTIKLNSNTLNSQSSYIKHLEKVTLSNISKIENKNIISKNVCPKIVSNFMKTSYIRFGNNSCNITKQFNTISQSKYLLSLNKKCSSFDAVILPRINQGI
jgi:hypothetical protein